MKYCFSVIMFCLSLCANAQIKSQDVLLTVDGDSIMASDFLNLYNKNLDLVKDESQKDVDAYLELFINYQLKVKEAEHLELDNNPAYIKEFTTYKNQLIKNYLSETKVTDELMKEAYDRGAYDIKANHILVRLDETDRDTLQAYQTLMNYRNRILDEGFDNVKAEVHNGKDIFAENLGYFSTFRMVYNFETAAYNTPVGEVSMPFRTRFGYHVVQVLDKRPSLGEVTVAHIILLKNDKDSLQQQKTRIHEIYKKIKQGEDFGSLAKQFSEDRSSAGLGGELPSFTSTQIGVPEFEAAAFGLKNIGDVSEPFQSSYGWQIVKLLNKKERGSYEETKADLETKVSHDSRSKLINSRLAQELRQKYKIESNPDAIPYFESLITPKFYSNSWALPDDFKSSQVLLKINGSEVTYDSFGQYLVKKQRFYLNKEVSTSDLIATEYKDFEEAELLAYHENHLEFENKEFASTLKDYRDGLLLFDLMEKEIWSGVNNDTIALKSFYDTHKNDYFWPQRVEVVIASAAKRKDLGQVEKMWKQGKSIQNIEKRMNVEEQQKVIFTKTTKPLDYEGFPQDLPIAGFSEIYEFNDAYHIVKVVGLLPKKDMTFNEAKGQVISDYQDQRETDWLKGLRKRYDVKINQDVLQKVKSQINK